MKESKKMKKCAGCGKPAESKSRQVQLNGREAVFCAACGRIELTAPGGEKIEGELQAVNLPARASFGGKSVTFHSAKPPAKGAVLASPVVSGMAQRRLGLSPRFTVAGVRAIMVREKVAPAAGPEAGAKNRRPRHKARTVGYSVRLFPA